MVIDLRQGWGKFPEYELYKFPDNSVKFKFNQPAVHEDYVHVIISFRSNDDIIALMAVTEVLDQMKIVYKALSITYMMYQQDDRKFDNTESFGLKMISRLINSFKYDDVSIFHPHSDKVEFIDNLNIQSNERFLQYFLQETKGSEEMIWVIPDEGAFKTQFKQIGHMLHRHSVTSLKVRDHITGEITTILNGPENLKGRDCFIVDDICLGGRTHLNIASNLVDRGCGKLYLVVSHGVFNNGIDHLLEVFDEIWTTDSICTLTHDRLKIYNL